MSTYSLESLLQWMRAPNSNVLWGWDAIAAMDRSKTNLILLQEYIARFGSDRYLPLVNGEAELVKGYALEALHDFQLDIPRLSFENTDLSRSKARLSMALLGGMQLSQRRGVDNWHIVQVVENDPLLGPWLYLDLNLYDVPGTVGQQGDIRLDLSKSSDFRLTFGPTEYEQLRGGEVIQELFENLEDDQRFFVLGSIQAGDDPLLRPQSFKLRTLSKGSASEPGDGALLILIRAQGSDEGELIGESFRYPIPDDAGKDYSATVLLDGPSVIKRLDLAQRLLEAVKERLTDEQFTVREENGRLISAEATAGHLIFEVSSTQLPKELVDGRWLTTTISRAQVNIPAWYTLSFYLTLRREADDRISIKWVTAVLPAYIVHFEDSIPWVEHPNYVWMDGYIIELWSVYDLVETESDLMYKPVEWDLDVRRMPDADSEPADTRVDWGPYIERLKADARARTLEAIEPLMSHAVSHSLIPQIPAGDFIRDCIKLNFGQAIEADVLAVPRDIGAFGRINPVRSAFVIDPLQPLILAGGTQRFATLPTVTGLVWTAEDSLRGTVDVDAGTFISDGRYQAPAAGSFPGRFLRVRITATDPASGYHSSALVTVVANGLVLNPLFYECGFEDEVELQAGVLGAGTLSWSVKNPLENEKGSVEPDGASGATYRTALKKPRKTYVLDEVEVANDITGQRQSMHVLVLMWAPTVTVVVVPDPSLGEGRVRLQAWLVGELCDIADWAVLLGPGQIDDDGVYTLDYATTERFVVITVVAKTVDLDGEGHIVLPLPLAAFATQLAAFGLDGMEAIK
ncbi:hypothetical protein PS3A_18830 [Pseudomonas sp. 3A(2025)]